MDVTGLSKEEAAQTLNLIKSKNLQEKLKTKLNELENTTSEQVDKPELARAASSLLSKSAEAQNFEMGRDNVGTVYDRGYQTEHENPYADSRFDAVPTDQSDPENELLKKQQRKEDQTAPRILSKLHEDPEFLPPREDMRDYRSETTKNEIKDEKDEEGLADKTGGLLTISDLDYEFDRNTRVAHRVASGSYIKQLASAKNIKVNDSVLMVNIPRGRVAHVEIGSAELHRMERDILFSTGRTAKYSHTVLNAGFDGISLEFVMV
jgi:hypothetical protein